MLDEHQYMYDFLCIVSLTLVYLYFFYGGRVSGLIFSSRFTLFSYLYKKYDLKLVF